MSEIRIKSQGAIKLFESDNTSHVTIASPASLSANRTITIPDADVTLGAGTTINNNADNRVITGSGTANTLEGEANLTYNGTFLGVGASADLGTGVHIKTADSGGGVESNADELIVEGSGNTGISILSGTSSVGAIHFNDSGGNERGAFKYNHNADEFQIKTNGTQHLNIDSAGQITKPLQCSFLVYNNGYGQSIPNNYNTAKVTMNTEIFDVGANQDTTSALLFTAPVTGKYVMTWNVMTDTGGANERFEKIYSQLVTSNRTIQIRAGQMHSDADEFLSVGASCVVDMDASDTAYIQCKFSRNSGSGATTIYGTSDGDGYTFWSGYLLG